MKALIFCAGAGSRMRPLTLKTPKPLVKVGGVPMVIRQIEALKMAGINEFVINVAHLSDLLMTKLGDGRDLGVSISYSVEGNCVEQALETRGGIVKALPMLTDGSEPFIAVAGDIVTNFPYERLIKVSKTLNESHLAHFVFVDNPQYHSDGDMCLSESGIVSRTIGKRLTFSSLGVYSPLLFKGLEPERSPLFPWMYQFIDSGFVSGEHYKGIWFNVGDMNELQKADSELKK